MRQQVEHHPQVVVVIDTCDLECGAVHQVTMRGLATIEPYHAARATRNLRRYLGPEVQDWDPRFDPSGMEPGTSVVGLVPDDIQQRDLSFTPSH